ncbi:MAG: RidA family protein [Campylobacteraceae bacterium]|nr:RidA family protein [Campylobacteraceae bacterium]
MKRIAINPWTWSQNLGYNQAEILEGVTRQIICSGQTSVDAKGKLQHAKDMRKQIILSLDNLEEVLHAAAMSLKNVTGLKIYTTDVDEAMKNFDVLASRFGPIQISPPMTLLGITRLALPSLMFEIEACAAD